MNSSRAPKASDSGVRIPGAVLRSNENRPTEPSWLQLNDIGGPGDPREQLAEVLGPVMGDAPGRRQRLAGQPRRWTVQAVGAHVPVPALATWSAPVAIRRAHLRPDRPTSSVGPESSSPLRACASRALQGADRLRGGSPALYDPGPAVLGAFVVAAVRAGEDQGGEAVHREGWWPARHGRSHGAPWLPAAAIGAVALLAPALHARSGGRRRNDVAVQARAGRSILAKPARKRRSRPAMALRPIEHAQPASNPPIDCFYVYPTVSSQTTFRTRTSNRSRRDADRDRPGVALLADVQGVCAHVPPAHAEGDQHARGSHAGGG